MRITNIEINKNWLFHQANTENFKEIITSGKIKPPIQIKPFSEIDIETENGPFYISLAKKTDTLYDSSYNYFIRDQYAFIIDNISTIKTHHMESNNLFSNTQLLRMFLPIRFSNWKDEYQTRKPISINKVLGIKIPSKRGNYYIGRNQYIDFFLYVMKDTNTYFPFVDIEKKIQIDPSNIKEYIRTR